MPKLTRKEVPGSFVSLFDEPDSPTEKIRLEPHTRLREHNNQTPMEKQRVEAKKSGVIIHKRDGVPGLNGKASVCGEKIKDRFYLARKWNEVNCVCCLRQYVDYKLSQEDTEFEMSEFEYNEMTRETAKLLRGKL